MVELSSKADRQVHLFIFIWLYPPGRRTSICGVRSDFEPLHLV